MKNKPRSQLRASPASRVRPVSRLKTSYWLKRWCKCKKLTMKCSIWQKMMWTNWKEFSLSSGTSRSTSKTWLKFPTFLEKYSDRQWPFGKNVQSSTPTTQSKSSWLHQTYPNKKSSKTLKFSPVSNGSLMVNKSKTKGQSTN